MLDFRTSAACTASHRILLPNYGVDTAHNYASGCFYFLSKSQIHAVVVVVQLTYSRCLEAKCVHLLLQTSKVPPRFFKNVKFQYPNDDPKMRLSPFPLAESIPQPSTSTNLSIIPSGIYSINPICQTRIFINRIRRSVLNKPDESLTIVSRYQSRYLCGTSLGWWAWRALVSVYGNGNGDGF